MAAKSTLRVLMAAFAAGGTLAAPQMARAQASSGGASPGETETLFDSLVRVFNSIANNAIGGGFADRVKDAALGLSQVTTTTAMYLAAAIALVSLIWRVMLGMLEKKSPVMPVVETVLFASIVVVVIANYGILVNEIWSIATMVIDGLTGGGGIGGALSGFITGSFSVLGSIFAAYETPSGLMEFMKASLDIIAGLVIAIVVLFLAAKALIEILGVLIMGPIYFGVGVIFGPVMIATIVSDYTRQWFNQWLNFMIGSAFLTVTAVAVLGLLSSIIAASAQTLGNGGTIIAMLGMLILVSSMAKLFQSVPAITDAIFPGRTGAGAAIQSSSSAAAAVTAAAAAIKTAGAATVAGAPKAVIGALNAPTHLKNAVDSAQNAVKGAAAKASGAAGNFAYQVKNSDAGRRISGTASGSLGVGKAGAGDSPMGSMAKALSELGKQSSQAQQADPGAKAIDSLVRQSAKP